MASHYIMTYMGFKVQLDCLVIDYITVTEVAMATNNVYS